MEVILVKVKNLVLHSTVKHFSSYHQLWEGVKYVWHEQMAIRTLEIKTILVYTYAHFQNCSCDVKLDLPVVVVGQWFGSTELHASCSPVLISVCGPWPAPSCRDTFLRNPPAKCCFTCPSSCLMCILGSLLLECYFLEFGVIFSKKREGKIMYWGMAFDSVTF